MNPDIAALLGAAASKYQIDPDLLNRVAMAESGGNPAARSPAGAQGVMQLMPGTARDMGVTNIADPAQNIDGGARYLKQQLNRFGSPALAAAAYNAGPGRVARAGGVPNIPETQAYVRKVAGGSMAGSSGQATLMGGDDSDIFGPIAQQPAAHGAAPHDDDSDIFGAAPPAAPAKAVAKMDMGAPGPTIADMRKLADPNGGVGRAAYTGVKKAVTALPFLPGDIMNMVGGGVDWAAQHAIGAAQDLTGTNFGAPTYMGSKRPHAPLPPTNYAHANGLADSADANAMRQKAFGRDYIPQTVPEQYAETVGSFLPGAVAPGGLAARTANVLLPAVASETAGQVTKGTPYEGAARFAGGMIGGIAAPGAARVVADIPGAPARAAARAIVDPTAVQTLRAAGVSLTPGQSMGGMAKNVEDLAVRAPILGPAITGARQRGNISLNRAVANRALEPLGETVPQDVKTGHDSVQYVADRLGKEYDDAAALVPAVAPDTDFGNAMTAIESHINELPTDVGNQYRNIIANRLTSRLSSGPVTGTQLRKIQSEIGQLAATKSASIDGAQQDLGHMLESVSDELKGLLGRADPAAASKIQTANQGWSAYVRLRNAAAKSNTDGIFTPGQLSTAVRVSDKSVGKGNVAKGRAVLQDLSRSASAVMPDQFGNPGTANALGLGGLIMGVPAAPVQTAAIAGGLGAAAVPYSLMGRGLAKAAPQAAPSAAQMVAAAKLLNAHKAAKLSRSAMPSVQSALVGGLLSTR